MKERILMRRAKLIAAAIAAVDCGGTVSGGDASTDAQPMPCLDVVDKDAGKTRRWTDRSRVSRRSPTPEATVTDRTRDRILARRQMLVAAALTAACDRGCGKDDLTRPLVCLEQEIVEDGSGPPRPTVCLSAPLILPEASTDAGTIQDASKDATKEGGGVRLNPLEVTADSGSSTPAPCLSVSPRACLKMAPPDIK